FASLVVLAAELLDKLFHRLFHCSGHRRPLCTQGQSRTQKHASRRRKSPAHGCLRTEEGDSARTPHYLSLSCGDRQNQVAGQMEYTEGTDFAGRTDTVGNDEVSCIAAGDTGQLRRCKRLLAILRAGFAQICAAFADSANSLFGNLLPEASDDFGQRKGTDV